MTNNDAKIVPCFRVDAKLLESAAPAYTPFVQGGTIPIRWLVHAESQNSSPIQPPSRPRSCRRGGGGGGGGDGPEPRSAPGSEPKPRPQAREHAGLPDAVIVCDAKASELRPHEPNNNNKKVRAHACKRCGFVSESASEVAAHTRRGARCGQKCLWPGCSNSYTNPSLLRVHVRKHTKERPFKCEFCPSEFMQSGDLVRHKRTHTGERPFVCEHCGSTFSVSSTLKRHMLTHRDAQGHKCKFPGCPARFPELVDLQHHVAAAHTSNAKAFVCDALGCGKQFACSSSLAAHQGRRHRR